MVYRLFFLQHDDSPILHQTPFASKREAEETGMRVWDRTYRSQISRVVVVEADDESRECALAALVNAEGRDISFFEQAFGSRFL